VSGSPRGIEFYGPQRHSWGHCAHLHATPRRLDASVPRHRGAGSPEAATRRRLALSFRLHLADTKEEAVRETTVFEEQVKFFAPLQRSCRAEEQLRILAQPTPETTPLLPQVEDSVRQRGWLCGTPDDVISFYKNWKRNILPSSEWWCHLPWARRRPSVRSS
jgi:alkanesulfonate monooxygenase SsuD/methylene tetrahydromethanopterin reductase-like flavin-dependent oxidoreductase (luciferase family)